MIVQAVADSFPTFEETEKSWPELGTGEARIVLFTPDRPLIKLPNFSFCRTALVDNYDYGGIVDGTFYFVDVPKGEHVVTCSGNDHARVSLDLDSHEIAYIQMSGSKLELLSLSVAQERIQDLNHGFEDALPFDDQPFVRDRRDKNPKCPERGACE